MNRAVGAAPAGAGRPRRWGTQTELAVANFPISGEPVPEELIRALAEIKSAAAVVNRRHGLVPDACARAIGAAAAEVASGAWADQFPVDVFQTGSGTSTNMNVNEVVAHRASELLGEPVHPNDHVNASQSSNDTFPAATRMAAAELVVADLVPALTLLATSIEDLAGRHRTTVKMGRTHLMDAVPMTFGQEAGGWARSVRLGVERLRAALDHVLELPLGGTAVGTGLNAPRTFGEEIAEELRARNGLAWREAGDHMEAQSTTDAIAALSGAANVVALSLHKIAGDLRLLGSGPIGGLGELRLPALQAGSSIMPGKVNPVIAEAVQQVAAQVVGNHATITFASTLSTLQLNTAAPVIARAIVSSLRLLAGAATVLREKCIDGIEVDAERMLDLARRSPALVTALTPLVGYDRASALVHRASHEGRPLHELVEETASELGLPERRVREAIDLLAMTGIARG
jgi:fumarate hydratase class II